MTHRIPNIAAGVIDATDLKSANFDDAELEQYQLIEGDVLTIRSNGSLSLVGNANVLDSGELASALIVAAFASQYISSPGSPV